jgi:prolyl-tRNA synthetase
MTHGDDAGLVLPPKLAPVQVVIVPIYRSDDERASVLEAAHALERDLVGVRVEVDDRDEHRPGYKFAEWELKGVPMRVELGPRDLESGRAPVYRRDTGEKEPWALTDIPKRVPATLANIQSSLYEQAVAFRDEHTLRPASYDEMRDFLGEAGGLAIAPWDGDPETETKVKADTKATIRCLGLEPGGVDGTCIVSGKPATEEAVFAQSY